MFSFHDQARKINIWSVFIVLSPYMGPLIAAFITSTQIWQWAFGVYTILTGLCLLAIVLFVEETHYDRHNKEFELAPMRQDGSACWGFSKGRQAILSTRHLMQ